MIIGFAIGFLVPVVLAITFYSGYRYGKSKRREPTKIEDNKKVKAMEELQEMMMYDVNKAYGR